jgi:hypothetical protein
LNINTSERKYIRLGLNCDASSWYLEDSNRYDWDGPKGQLDED